MADYVTTVDVKPETDYRQQLQELQDRLQQEEDAHTQLLGTKKKLEGEIQGFKKDIEDLELTIQKVSLIGIICFFDGFHSRSQPSTNCFIGLIKAMWFICIIWFFSWIKGRTR